ncbi:MAG: K(+)-insensitive pyrophosphate-energized proton pump [Candidatus Amesbacteria bacterium GW2011_GWB1_48_13]|uniref:K(+)-insensitive pyrophosphate-energized proton pump n=1 Tax=Candidatus Amesbacteria bacterium GW2011_GWB1_48_13 TaxID=1618362 RepID=A0A0G1UR64_9BACT|nr:MAG: K(+)-insensitive pyrophosphate-energized proton pump [Candidatus Amesbacteria bacterium GW2011_GWB1_48_13]
MAPIPFAVTAALAAIAYGAYLFYTINKSPSGNEKMNSVAAAIAEGAVAYLNRQAITLAAIGAVLAIVLWLALGSVTAIGFVIGGFVSALAGFIGMHTSIRANVRTAAAAQKGLGPALSMAFQGGSVTGFLVVGLALLTTALFYAWTGDPRAMIGLGFGGSLGTDMVGKIEAGIPEDDPRNPGVIADLVGDNVGDCAGMAADLFETYVVTLLSAMLIASLTFGSDFPSAVVFPLYIAGGGVFTSILGSLFVRTNDPKSIMPALSRILSPGLLLSGFPLSIARRSPINKRFSCHSHRFRRHCHDGLFHRSLYLQKILLGQKPCPGFRFRPRFKHHRRTGTFPQIHFLACYLPGSGCSGGLSFVGPVRCRAGCSQYVVLHRNYHSYRCFRSDYG